MLPSEKVKLDIDGVSVEAPRPGFEVVETLADLTLNKEFLDEGLSDAYIYGNEIQSLMALGKMLRRSPEHMEGLLDSMFTLVDDTPELNKDGALLALCQWFKAGRLGDMMQTFFDAAAQLGAAKEAVKIALGLGNQSPSGASNDSESGGEAEVSTSGEPEEPQA